jgi:hypothetical protein
MRGRCATGVLAAAAFLAGLAAAAEPALVVQEVLAGAPTDLSVTVYRAPRRNAGSLDLEYLAGFALIRETRLVRVPVGLSRVRFEGVADGIEPVSAIVTGLPNAILEKNLDAQLLSPATLIATANGRPVQLVRSNSKTGRIERVPGVILSGPSADGVVFQTQEGIEALRCSGMPESFAFPGSTGLTATPTLSLLVQAAHPITQQIQLSYLASGFDWAADYTATLSADGKRIDLGAWVTLANSNVVGFPAAQTQVVAGRLNREGNSITPLDAGGPILARCWPRGSTSDAVRFLQVPGAMPLGFQADRRSRAMMFAAAALQEVTVSGARVTQEQLGDLKLYRVPTRTNVASRQSKQVRLLDRASIPVRRIYIAEVEEDRNDGRGDPHWDPATAVLRTRNDAANHLGLPLPSGQVVVFQRRGAVRVFLNQANMVDHAVNEEVEISLGRSSDVQVQTPSDKESITDPAGSASHVEVRNARDSIVDFELRLRLQDGSRVVRADHPLGTRNGRPVFRLRIPAHQTVRVLFMVEHEATRVVRPTE